MFNTVEPGPHTVVDRGASAPPPPPPHAPRRGRARGPRRGGRREARGGRVGRAIAAAPDARAPRRRVVRAPRRAGCGATPQGHGGDGRAFHAQMEQRRGVAACRASRRVALVVASCRPPCPPPPAAPAARCPPSPRPPLAPPPPSTSPQSATGNCACSVCSYVLCVSYVFPSWAKHPRTARRPSRTGVPPPPPPLAPSSPRARLFLRRPPPALRPPRSQGSPAELKEHTNMGRSQDYERPGGAAVFAALMLQDAGKEIAPTRCPPSSRPPAPTATRSPPSRCVCRVGAGCGGGGGCWKEGGRWLR